MSAIDRSTFIQRSRLGNAIFDLNGHYLRVSGKKGWTKIDLEADLTDIAPHFERLKWRSYTLILFPLALAFLTAFATWILRFLPKDVYDVAAMLGGTFVICFLWAAIRGVPPIELVRFRTKSGVSVFDVIKEKDQASEFEEFVEKLRATIKSLQSS